MNNQVCILEMKDGCPVLLKCFEESAKGNKQAETLFRKRARALGALTKDLPEYLDDGLYEKRNDQIFILHAPFEPLKGIL